MPELNIMFYRIHRAKYKVAFIKTAIGVIFFYIGKRHSSA